MINKRSKNKKINKWLFWTPRVLTFLFVLFISLFALDIFGNGYTFWETVVGLFMHLIPSFLLIIFFIIAWRYELVGAVGFFGLGLLYIGMILINSLKGPFEWYMLSYPFIIGGPAIIIGILFFLNWKKKISKQ